jgi:hypothetical protein
MAVSGPCWPTKTRRTKTPGSPDSWAVAERLHRANICSDVAWALYESHESHSKTRPKTVPNPRSILARTDHGTDRGCVGESDRNGTPRGRAAPARTQQSQGLVFKKVEGGREGEWRESAPLGPAAGPLGCTEGSAPLSDGHGHTTGRSPSEEIKKVTTVPRNAIYSRQIRKVARAKRRKPPGRF